MAVGDKGYKPKIYTRICPICKKEFKSMALYRKYCTPTRYGDGCGFFAQKLRSGLNRNGIILSVPMEYGIELLEKQKYKCNICGDELKIGKDVSIDHVIPISKGGEHSLKNIAFTHWECNLMKHDMTMERLIEISKKIANFH